MSGFGSVIRLGHQEKPFIRAQTKSPKIRSPFVFSTDFGIDEIFGTSFVAASAMVVSLVVSFSAFVVDAAEDASVVDDDSDVSDRAIDSDVTEVVVVSPGVFSSNVVDEAIDSDATVDVDV